MVLEFIIENLNGPTSRREFRKKYEGSPTYDFENDVMASNGDFHIENFEEQADINISKYVPLDLAIIENNSSERIEVQLNQSDERAYSVTANNTTVIERGGIRSMKIVNKGSAQIDQGDIHVTVKRAAISSDKQILQEKRNIYGYR